MTYVYLTENLLILFTRKIVSKSSGKSNKLSGFQSKQNNKDWYLLDQTPISNLYWNQNNLINVSY